MRLSKFAIFSACLAMSISIMGCRQESTSDAPKALNALDVQYPRPSRPAPFPEALPGRSSTDTITAKAAISGYQCYQDLCAAKGELDIPKIKANAIAYNQLQYKYYTENIEPDLKELVTSLSDERRTTYESIKAKESEFANLSLDSAQLHFLKGFYYLMKPDQIDKKIVTSIQAALVDKEYLKAYKYVAVRGASSYFQSLYPEEGVQKGAALEVKKLIDLQDQLNKKIKAKLLVLNNVAMARALKNEELDRDELESIYPNSYAIRVLYDFVFDPKISAAIDMIPKKTNDFYEFFKNENSLFKLSQRIHPKSDLYSSCSKNFSRVMNLSPTAEQIKQFESMIPAVKEAVIDQLSSDDPVREQIKKVSVLLPFDTQSIANAWKYKFKSKAAQAREFATSVKKLQSGEIFLLALLGSLTEDKPMSNCDDLFDSGIYDAIYTEAGSSRLSWVSVRYPQYGVGILAHELGHMVASNSTKVTAQKMCLANKQGTNLYLNEDLADVISAKALEKLDGTLQLPRANMGCAMASFFPDMGLINQFTDDVHSSNLYRALQIASIRKEAIPESCEALVKAQNERALMSCH